MTARILNGAPLAAQLQRDIDEAKTRLINLKQPAPCLATIRVGGDLSAQAYRRSIERTMQRVGISHLAVDLAGEIAEADFAARLDSLSADPSVTGMLVLMPLPAQLAAATIYRHLSPFKDVDGFTPSNAGRLHMGLPSLRPSTPAGGIELLDFYGIEIAGTRAVVIGRSNVVGGPMAALLTQRNATVTVCHRQTRALAEIAREADVLAVAAGHPGLVTAEMVKPGATIVDFGVNVLNGKVVGDVDFEAVSAVAGAITPVPGGTGPVTAMVLARNTVAAGFAAMYGSLGDADLVFPPTVRRARAGGKV
jgi:methylenetetrahydrofolate dehydrogenase (NADP+)/methenyltetrahydrofolate cyclohydrolase